MISVSVLKSTYSFDKTISMLEDIDEVDYIHVDLMDGVYAGENNFDIDDVVNKYKNISKPLDIHLMINDPIKYVDKLSVLKPKYITVHPDACQNIEDTIKKIKSYDIGVGLAIDINVDADIYEKYYKAADLALIMSVKAGKGGQDFNRDCLSKLEYFTFLQDYEDFIIEIDGGINEEVYHKLKRYPIDIFVIGSYICMNENYKRPINKLLEK